MRAFPDSHYELHNLASRLCGNKMPLCSQHLATDRSSDSPVSVSVIFLPFSWSQSIAGVCLQVHAFGSLCYVIMKCYQKLHWFLGNLKINLPFFTASCICVITWCIAVSVGFHGLERLLQMWNHAPMSHS